MSYSITLLTLEFNVLTLLSGIMEIVLLLCVLTSGNSFDWNPLATSPMLSLLSFVEHAIGLLLNTLSLLSVMPLKKRFEINGTLIIPSFEIVACARYAFVRIAITCFHVLPLLRLLLPLLLRLLLLSPAPIPRLLKA